MRRPGRGKKGERMEAQVELRSRGDVKPPSRVSPRPNRHTLLGCPASREYKDSAAALAREFVRCAFFYFLTTVSVNTAARTMATKILSP